MDRHKRQQVLYHQHARYRRVRPVCGGQQDTERDEHDLIHVLAGMEPFRVPGVQEDGHGQVLQQRVRSVPYVLLPCRVGTHRACAMACVHPSAEEVLRCVAHHSDPHPRVPVQRVRGILRNGIHREYEDQASADIHGSCGCGGGRPDVAAYPDFGLTRRGLGYGRQQSIHVRHTCRDGEADRPDNREPAADAAEHCAGMRAGMRDGEAAERISSDFLDRFRDGVHGVRLGYLSIRTQPARSCFQQKQQVKTSE